MKRKISILLLVMLLLVSVGQTIFASGEEDVIKVDSSVTLSEASKTTQKNLTAKDEEIQGYMKPREEGGNGLSKTNATVLYYLHVLQVYSYPVVFVLLAIASLNFFIIGNKKLDKREQGFKWLVSLIVGLIVLQVLPLLFAIIVAGR